METFGSALKGYRRALGWSQERVAALSGMDLALVSRLESGQRNPTPDSLAKLSGALGLPDKDRDYLYIEAGFVPPDVPTAALRALLAAYRVAASAAETTEEAA